MPILCMTIQKKKEKKKESLVHAWFFLLEELVLYVMLAFAFNLKKLSLM